MIGLRSRLAVALLVFGLCLVYALPSVPYIGTALENVLPSKKINLGLDLKGGIHLTLGVDVAKAVSNSLALAGQDIRRLAKDEKIVVLHPRVVGNDKLEFALPRVEDEAKLQEILQKNFPQLNVGEPRRTEAGLRYVAEFRPEEINRIEDMALDQALRTIRNRIDQFGVAEPDIRKQEGNRIQVQLPGLSDPRRAVQILGQTAHLEFHLVRDDVDPNKAVLPSGVMALPLLEKGHDGSEVATRLIAVEKDAMLSGEDVADAQPTFEKNRASVSLNFNSRGATLFENVTGENVGRRMAIVLDDKVYSAPVIQQRIAGGRAVITGQFTTQEATDLAIVLRAGSLPAPVSVLEERTVGPSLGQESIDSGINAALVGAAAVVVFMAIYYGMSGVIADVMLCFTMLIGHGWLRRRPDPARHRRYRADHRYGRGRQRADLRTHTRRTAPGALAPGGRQGRFRARHHLHHRLEPDHHHRHGAPVPVRHGPHPRFCRHPVAGYRGLHVHGHFCVAGHL